MKNKIKIDPPFQFDDGDKSWWTTPKDEIGCLMVSFDKKKWRYFYQDYPEKFTEEERKIIRKENPTLARLKGDL